MDINRTQNQVFCPNCEETVEKPKTEPVQNSFPCPKCAFEISLKAGGEKDDGTLKKLLKVAGKEVSGSLFLWKNWLLILGIASLSGMLILGLFLYYAREISFYYYREFLRESGQPVSSGVITNSLGMKLKLIPEGSFMMGSGNGQADEKPVHKVTISKSFYMGVHEVSVEQYCDLMGERPLMPMPPKKPMLFVTWYKAKEFCKKLSEKENARYRLPTEAEWEYSIRGGTQTEFYWGDKYTPGHEWCHYNSGRPTRSTHTIGTSEPNPWGLFDMAGNVQEWCEDNYSNYSQGEKTDPNGPASGNLRVIRGGGYDMTEGALRSASRNGEPPDTQMGPGFRVVREL